MMGEKNTLYLILCWLCWYWLTVWLSDKWGQGHNGWKKYLIPNNALTIILTNCMTLRIMGKKARWVKKPNLRIYDFMRILVTKMLKNYSPKKSPRMVKNTSSKLVNIKAFQKYNWWKAGGYTNLGDNSIENVLGLLYANIGLCIFKSCS